MGPSERPFADALPPEEPARYPRAEVEAIAGDLLDALSTVIPFVRGIVEVSEGEATTVVASRGDWADGAARSRIRVPLVAGTDVLGVVTLESGESDPDLLARAKIVAALSRPAATAISFTRRYDAERAARKRADHLAAATESIITTLDVAAIYTLILNELRRVVPYDCASIQELKGEEFIVLGGVGFPDNDATIGLRFPVASPDSPNGEVARRREPMTLGDAPREYASFLSGPPAIAGIHSWIGVPLLFGDRLIGLLTIDKRERHFYRQEHVEAALAFARRAAIAMENARLYSAAQRELAEREAAEAALRERELRYREVFENTSDCLYLLEMTADGSFRNIEVNPAVERTAGLSRTQMIGKTQEETVSLETARAVNEKFRRCVEEGTIVDEELQLDLPTGRRLFHSTLIPVAGPAGAPIRIVGISRDITERKGAEELLRKAADRSALLLDLYEQAPQLTDKQLYDFALDHAVRLTGSTMGFLHLISDDQNTVILTTWSSGVMPACTTTPAVTHYPIAEAGNWADCVRFRRPMVFNDFPSSANQKGLPPGHVPLQRFMSIPVMERDKTRIIFGVGNKTEDYDDDDIVQIQLVAKELQKLLEERHAREALLESEQRLRQVAETIDEVFWLTDVVKRQMIYVSPAYEKIWGRTCESLCDSPDSWLDSVAEEDKEAVRQAAMVLGATDTEYRIVRTDGSMRWIHARAFPVKDSEGRVYRIAGVAEDVTSRRQLEQQYLQAQKMEAVGLLAGGVAHDFNNLLAVILNCSELLGRQTPSTDSRRKRIDDIVTAVKRAAVLVRQLLAFSRKQVLEPRVLDLNTLVTDMEKMLRRVLREDIRIVVSTHHEPATIKADPGLIEQVIMNLAVNAGDAMTEGGTLTIEISNVDVDDDPRMKSGAFVLLTVTDTGTGMDAETQARIFEPFFTTKPTGKGTGLGLATVYGIVEQSDGSVFVESEIGRGTTFTIYLPRVDEVTDVRDAPRLAGMDVGGTETILLVEDDDALRDVTREMLERGGYTVLSARDGAEALDIDERHRGDLDLLIADVVMPGMSGPHLATRLRPRHPRLKVLYASGYTDNVVLRRDVLDRGALLLNKPFTASTLAEKVREALASAPVVSA